MRKEIETKKTPNERLLGNLPEIATKLDNLWQCFANRHIGFAGGGNLRGDPQPDELGMSWSKEINELLSGCEARISSYDDDENEWGEMVVSLSDLADGLNFYFGPFWQQVTDEERDRVEIRMDMNAQRLLKIFTERGYLEKDVKPFKLNRR